jgi:hypothetical protein
MVFRISIMTMSITMKVSLRLPKKYSSSPKYCKVEDISKNPRGPRLRGCTHYHRKHVGHCHQDEEQGDPDGRVDIVPNHPLHISSVIVFVMKPHRIGYGHKLIG